MPIPTSAGPSPPHLREVLTIDANEDHQTLSATALGRRGFKVAIVDSGREGMRLTLSHPFDAIVLDQGCAFRRRSMSSRASHSASLRR